MMGIAQERSLPKITPTKQRKKLARAGSYDKEVDLYLFVDEFTSLYDTQIGLDAVELLEKLGYKVGRVNHPESARSFLSKGLLKEAQKIINKNISLFSRLIDDKTPLIGIEPSAILGFRDEYPRLASDKTSADNLAKNSFTFEEFIEKQFQKGNIQSNQFTADSKDVKLHGHCHQKALSTTASGFNMLNIPENYDVKILNTGCCGMAGSFGYEKEHYKISMQVGEDTLFPKLRKLNTDTLIAAAGTSCRHQIKDGVNKEAQHPISILRKALV
jgi:hypothetical protein